MEQIVLSKKIIEVKITKDGIITLELSGFEGLDCVNETRDIESNLGKVIKKELHKNLSKLKTSLKLKK